MVKSIIKEVFIMILLCAAIVLLFGIIFYDYIPVNKVIPNKVSYTVPEDIRNELESEVSEARQNITLVYDIDASDLKKYISAGSYIPGKPNPFESYEETVNNSVDNTNNNGNNTNTNSGGSNSTGNFFDNGTSK
jgi:hypothetical protein